MCSRWNAAVGRQLLGDILSCSELRYYLIPACTVRDSGAQKQSPRFFLAFAQANLDVPIYMELPAGMEIEGAKHKK